MKLIYRIGRRIAVALVAPLSIALFDPASAFAQTTPPQPTTSQSSSSTSAYVEKSGSNGLEEVVVTAQYRKENLQTTPIAISVISADEIQQRTFTQSYEIGYTVPNVSLRPAQAAFGNTMTAFIRGIGQNDFDQAFEPGVGIYVDEVYQPFTLGTQMDLLDMERVEVLRGPQGTLFGRGSIGGVIRYISKRPEGTNTGYAELTTGSYRRVDVRAGYDFKLSDNVFARVAGVAKNSNGYQKVYDFACLYPSQAGFLPIRDPSKARHCQTGTQGGIDEQGLRGTLRWIITDAVEASFALDYEHDTSEAKADTLMAIQYPTDLSGHPIPTNGYVQWNTEYAQHVPDPTTAFGVYGFGIPYDNRFIPKNIYSTYATYNDPYSGLTFNPQSGLDRMAGSGTLEWKITDQTMLTVVAAHTQLTSQISSDADASPMNLQVTGGQQDFKWSTEEARLNGHAWDRLDWTVGAFFYQSNAENHQAVSFPPILWGVFRNIVGLPPFVAASIIDAPGNVSVNTANLADSKSYAGFANGIIDLTDKARLTLGVRYSNDKKDVAFDNTFVQAPIHIDYNHTDWRVGFDYKFNVDTMVYASAATGYRPPAYNPRPFTADQAVQVGGEQATAYELGIKADMLQRTLRTNLALFYTDYKDRIVPIGGTECIPPFVPANTPGAVQDSNGNICLATTSLTSYQQLHGAHIQGAELEVAWRPIPPLEISGSYGFTDWSSPDIDNCDFNQDGLPDPGITCIDRPTYVPKNNWSLTASYDIALANGSRITPRADAYGQSQICTSITSTLSCADGYTLVNLRLQWASANNAWTVAVGGTNVTNKEYWLNTFDLTPFGQNTVEGQPGRPREWYASFTRNF